MVYLQSKGFIRSGLDQGSYYFLSPPRRFGKSLLVSTLKELFLGNRKLFVDCWIHDHWDWEEQYPVIKISFTEVSYRTHGLAKALEIYLSRLAKKQGVVLETTTYPEQFFFKSSNLCSVPFYTNNSNMPKNMKNTITQSYILC